MAEYYTEGEIGKLTISVPAAGAAILTFELLPDAKFQILDKDRKDRVLFICENDGNAKCLEKDMCKVFSIESNLPVDSNLLLQAKNFHNKVRVYTEAPQANPISCSKLEFI